MFCPQEYEEAYEAFQDGLELDPGNAEIEKMIR
jgi:lipoprotein NlpI